MTALTNQGYQKYFSKLEKLYEKPATKISLALILTLFSLSTLIFIAIQPAIKTIVKLNKELKEKQEINLALEKKVKNLKQAQTTYISLQNDLSFIDKSLPQKADFNHFASEINYLSYNHNLILSSVNYSDFDLILPEKDYNELKVNLKLAGSFSDIKNFLNDLYILDRIVRIDSLAFSNKSSIPQAGLQVDIAGFSFWLSSKKGK